MASAKKFFPNNTMDTKQAADYIGIHEVTLKNWRRMNRGPKFYKVGPRRVRYKKADVEAWLNDTARQPEAG